MNIEEVNPADLVPADYNPREISEHQLDALKRSIQRWGFVQPIIVNERTGKIVGGHQRVTAALELAYKTVPVTRVDLSESAEKALNIALNKISGDWDNTRLAVLLEDIAGEFAPDELGFEDFELDELLSDVDLGDLGAPEEGTKYTRKVEIPVYEPTGPCPPIDALFNPTKTDDLRERIESADIPDDVRKFLHYAAGRHTAFNFQQIAEFYAHSDADIQGLMEESALVLIDFEQAIERGFVRLSERMQGIIASDYPDGPPAGTYSSEDEADA